MAQYYFNLRNDLFTEDDEGADLSDDDAAREHAIKAARSMAAHSVMSGSFTGSHSIEVLDADRNSVATIRFD
jgi:hypothetical protein